jgi:hypothetical protein
MSIVEDLLQKPARLSLASQYTAINGLLYLASGALLLAWPGAVQTLFGDAAFVAREEGLFRVVGLCLAVIGWFYLFGGRSGARQVVAASVFDRLTLVPLVLAPLAMSGVFPHTLMTFAVLDPLLGVGAWLLLRRG